MLADPCRSNSTFSITFGATSIITFRAITFGRRRPVEFPLATRSSPWNPSPCRWICRGEEKKTIGFEPFFLQFVPRVGQRISTNSRRRRTNSPWPMVRPRRQTRSVRRRIRIRFIRTADSSKNIWKNVSFSSARRNETKDEKKIFISLVSSRVDWSAVSARSPMKTKRSATKNEHWRGQPSKNLRCWLFSTFSLSLSLIWLGSCARAIPIVCKNLKTALEIVTTSADSITSPVFDRWKLDFSDASKRLPSSSVCRKIRGSSQPKRTLDKVKRCFPLLLSSRTSPRFQTDKTSWMKIREMFLVAHVDLFKFVDKKSEERKRCFFVHWKF